MNSLFKQYKWPALVLTVVLALASLQTSHAAGTSQPASGVAQASTTSGQFGTLIQGAATTAAPTYTTAKTYPLSLDAFGALRILVMNTDGSAAALATDATAGATIATTGPQVMCNGASAAPSAVTTGQATQFYCDVNGRLQTVPNAGTIGGASTHYITSAASTNSTSVKGSAGQIYTISAVNTTATLYYLRIYNSASAPTCSSATGFIETIPIPASTTGGGIVRPITVGQSFATGIGYCLTGGGSSTDNSNAATGVYLTILYK